MPTLLSVHFYQHYAHFYLLLWKQSTYFYAINVHLCKNTVIKINKKQGINSTARVERKKNYLPELVVVPGHQLDEGLGELDASLSVEDGGP